MHDQKEKDTAQLLDLGRKHTRKRQREIEEFVRETAAHAAEKRVKKLFKHYNKKLKKVNDHLDNLEKGLGHPSDPDRDENGFYQLRRRKK